MAAIELEKESLGMAGIQFVDHIAIAVPQGTLEGQVDAYSVFHKHHGSSPATYETRSKAGRKFFACRKS